MNIGHENFDPQEKPSLPTCKEQSFKLKYLAFAFPSLTATAQVQVVVFLRPRLRFNKIF
jgi:hypothetical protein